MKIIKLKQTSFTFLFFGVQCIKILFYLFGVGIKEEKTAFVFYQPKSREKLILKKLKVKQVNHFYFIFL